MGHFCNGSHYSTQSKLGPTERFGIEDEMSFHDFANELENNGNSKSSKKTNNNNISNSDKMYSSGEV